MRKGSVTLALGVALIAVAVAAAASNAVAQAALAAPSLPRSQASSSTLRVIDRPEIRSYQPYSTLQYGLRPRSLPQRGVRTPRPRIILPKPAAPLSEYGPPAPYASQFYSYCPDTALPIEPREGPYGPRPVGPRSCP